MDYIIKKSKSRSIKAIPLPKREFKGRDVEEKKQGKKRRKKKKLHILRKILVAIFGMGLLSCFLGLGMVKGILDSTPPLTSFHFGPTAFATKIVDKNGNTIDTLVQEGSNREAVKFEDIPAILVNAFVAIEDERFWEHSGVDFRSIARAIYGVVKSDSSRGGGSTITQQLIKNSVFNSGQNEKGFEKYVRKLQEQYIALQYESQDAMSKKEIKEQIMADYLNTIYLGSNTLGVKVAAKKYFDKELKDLTISEAAVIASITKNPSKNNPITHPENNKIRQRQTLKNMRDQNLITVEEYEEAINDDVYSRIQNVEIKNESTLSVYTYFTEAVIDQLQDDLVKRLGYTQSLASNLMYSGGLRVETTMDPEIQRIVDAEINSDSNYTVKKYSIDYRLSIHHSDDTETHYSQIDVENYHVNTLKNKKYDGLFATKDLANQYINSFKDSVIKDGDTIIGETLNYILEPQASFVLINHNTGEVLALSGGRGEKNVSRSLNRATKSKRQPGSTFKVLSSFAPALELYNKTLATTYYDSEYSYKISGSTKTFKNWYSTGYLGFQNIRAGIIYSLNIIAVRCLMETVTPEVGVKFAKKLGISSLDEIKDANPATALGGLTYGVSNLELTNAFAAIANGGNYQTPILYTRVYDHYGNVILDNTKNKPVRVMSKENAYLLTSAMAGSMVGGKAFSSSNMNVTPTSTRAHFDGMAVAGKSGTTTNNNDIWFIGFTPFYTAGIWGGCDENQSLQDTRKGINNGGTAFHKNIWRRIMSTIHTSLPKTDFTRPPAIIEKKVCRKSGLLAGVGCEHDLRGDATYTELFVDGTQPRRKCDIHADNGLILMPNRYMDLVTDDTQFVMPNAEVIPIVPDSIGGNTGETSNVIRQYLD
ncbi:MAG: transglycosylase domain-containing protein [Lachnospiraceae bacterium]|nr:transglycosylase domain-containing protein [Lachnospiraceae bacterium]